ncbi:MAG: hypothetical protein ACJ735_07710 [Actinomycetes bacterium]
MPQRLRRPWRAAALLAIVSAACASQPAHARNTKGINHSLPYSQSCLGSPTESGSVTIPWQQLRNPILSHRGSAVRDIGVRARHGAWQVFYTSAVGTAPTWRIGSASSPTLQHWSVESSWPPQSGVAGVASPDITQRPDGTYVVTYESNPRETAPAGEDKIYYRTSTDLATWSAPRRLMPGLHSSPSDRVIDPALAWTHRGLFLGYKYNPRGGSQHFEIAWSPSGSLDGPWVYVGRPDIKVFNDTIENYEFLEIDGMWHVLGTSNKLDRPWLFVLKGDPAKPSGWLNWSPGRELEIPLEQWNRAPGVPGVTFDQANSAYLCDARRVDGYFYLFYIGSKELKKFGGWGHTVMGVARSKNFVTWQVPCGPGKVSTPTGCA